MGSQSVQLILMRRRINLAYRPNLLFFYALHGAIAAGVTKSSIGATPRFRTLVTYDIYLTALVMSSWQMFALFTHLIGLESKVAVSA